MRYLALIPNLNSASGVCINRIASEFRRNGDVFWIMTESPVRESEEYVISIEKKHSYVNKFTRFIHRIRTILLYPIWPRQRLFFFHKLYRHTKEFIRNHEIDGIICVYNSVETLMVGRKVKNEHPNIIYIPYFLDALYGGQKPYFMTEKRKRHKALKVESKLLENADRIIMMTPAQKAYIQDNISPIYLSKTEFLDIPLYCPVEYTINESKFFPEDTINLLYCGSLPNNIRDPKVFIQIFSKINNEKCHLYFAGSADYDSVLSEAVIKCSRIHLLGKVSHSIAEDMMREADVLVNIGNSLAYMVPSKIFEYMSLGKPIISTYRIKDDPCIEYLNKYQNSLLINEQDNCSASARLIEDFLASSICHDMPDKNVFYKNTPAAFFDCINRLITNPR